MQKCWAFKNLGKACESGGIFMFMLGFTVKYEVNLISLYIPKPRYIFMFLLGWDTKFPFLKTFSEIDNIFTSNKALLNDSTSYQMNF